MSEAEEFKAAMEGLDRSEDRPWERDRSDSLSAPRRPRMSFSEVPEELLSLDLNDIALPPMNSKAEVKKSHHYSLRDLIRNTDALPPVNELRPKQKEGKIVIDPMRDRARYQPLAPGTPTRFQALLSLRDSAGAQGQLTADFFSRTGLEIPSELDPGEPRKNSSPRILHAAKRPRADRPSLTAPQAFPRGLVGGSAVPVAPMHWSVLHECADHSVLAAPTHPSRRQHAPGLNAQLNPSQHESNAC